jgi:hypothetical protein
MSGISNAFLEVTFYMGYKKIWYVFGDEFVDELGDLFGGSVGEVGELDICGNEGDVFLV